MKVLQIIDSLHPGGAEKMAVNLFNELNKNDVESYLCVTREESLLKDEIVDFSKYFFLKRKRILDLRALRSLHKFVRANKIDVIHAHGTSYFIGFLLKFFINTKIVFIWHDHYGDSEYLKDRNYKVLKQCSKYFDGVVCVNRQLLRWNKKMLLAHNYKMINNFVNLVESSEHKLTLKGKQCFKIICVANLRPQKDHHLLIDVFNEFFDNKEISLHLFGKDFKDSYSEDLKTKIEKTRNIFYYGSHKITKDILSQADIGILVSKSEGLPLAILEYAMAGLPVICTKVGECPEVIGEYGIMVEPGAKKDIANAIEIYSRSEELRLQHGAGISIHVKQKFSAEVNISKFIDFYKQCS
ncbi:Glycosyltransferase involved in cell wall bisynthesis [Zunongwangia mangrovi]|uniref:Glycosyltransferase involved in cell wall bisynthesis n=1 Tax=Zunongwangia mangrovi TaxID=1334022 RepID=A0A1I1LNL0_9FLAO|nr:glycosyltransferase family 4 protein [Zunongwangia mangrovi]SFC74536.1 Glycosyltransferase involved in cell wall bisynthesis [Zunongwangia mangrovi]